MKKFFVNLYKSFIHLSWVEWTIDYCKNNPLMAGIIGGLTLFIILLICVMIGKRRKRKKAARAAAKAAAAAAQASQIDEKEEPQTPILAEEPKAPVLVKEPEPPLLVEEPAPVKEEKKPIVIEPIEPVMAELVEDEPVEVEIVEEVPEEKAAIVPKKVAEPAPTPVRETPAPIQEKATPVKETRMEKPLTKKQIKAQEAEELLAAVENADEETYEPLSTHYDEDEMEKQAKYKGKWTICRVLTDAEDHEEMFFFELRASNGEKLLSSEEYTTYQGALRGIETHRANILKGNLKLTLSKKGDFIFKLLSGKNMLLCMGENYPTRARCESAMESTVRFAETAILDENVQDIVIKVPKEEDTPPLPPVSENSRGKWIISSKQSDDGESIYFFELFANNGEKLLSSEEYTTYTGAVNGIQTHRRNIKQNNFRISLTKRGDYIYKLLNGNGQLLCLGEHYKTKRLCQNAVDSVQRFALNSPVLKQA